MCYNLLSITIPSGVTSIGENAFLWCCGLTSITVYNTTPLVIDESTFYQSYQATLYVPAGCKATYQAADYWKNFGSIVELPALPGDGSAENPFSCAEANTFVAKLTADTPTETEYYIQGKVSTIQYNFGYQYGNATFYISDDGTKNGEFHVYRTKYFDGANYAGGRVPNIGDEVVLCGKLVNYQGTTPETASNACRLILLNGKTVGSGLEVGDLFVAKTPEDVEMFFVVDQTGKFMGKSSEIGCSVGYTVGNRPETSDNPLCCIDANYAGAITTPATAEGFPVQVIAPNAFRNAKLTSVTMPATVWDVETDAFKDCQNLASVTLPEGVILNNGAFQNCTSLTSIELPVGVQIYGSDGNPKTFGGCTNLTAITVNDETPYNLQGSYLVDTPSLVTLYVPAGSKAAYQAADYWNEFMIEELAPVSPVIAFVDAKVKEICVANWDTSGDGKLSFDEAAAVNDLDEVFKYNEEITSFNELQYFTGLTDIGDHAFAGCTALTSVTLPSTVTHIYDGAFEGCLQLESVDFNGCKVAIHSVAFSECRNLTSLVLPVGCYPDGYSVFNGCSSLLSVVMEPCDNPVEVWSSDVFRDCNSLETATVYGRYLHGPGNFTNCSRLTTVTFIDDIPGNSFSQNFQGVPDDVLFVIPDGSAETFLHNGYFNLSDKSGLGMVRDEFEAEAERIVLMSMANSANVLANGNLESTDVSCFLSKEYPSEDIVPATIVENEGVNGSRCVAVTSKAGAAHDYDTQFWIRLPKTLPAGTKYKLSFDYRATAAVSINTECHNEPGQYVEWGCLPFSDFTTTWQHFDEVVTVPATCDGTDNGEFLKDFRSITFTLAADREKNITFYFDNFRLLLVEESPLLNAVNQARTVVNNATDYADVFGQIDVIKQAGRDFLAANELADEVDVTGAFILNPDFDRFDRGWQAPMGWITSGYQNGRCENGDVVIDQFIQIWRSEWIDDHDEPSVLDDYKLSQTIRQLPAGNYRLEADCIASWSTDDRDITGAYLFVGDEQVPVATLHGKPQHYTLDFTISEASDVEIGMKTFNTNANWIAADNFRLYSIYPSNDPTDITQLNNAIYVEPQIGNVGRAFSMDVKLKNELSIRAYEFKLKLPQGVTLETDNNGAWLYELSGRNSNYSPKLNYDAATNTYHFAVMSTVSGNDGAVMTLKLQVSDEMVVGEYPIRIYDVKYSLTEAYQTLPVQETVSTLNIQEKTFLKGDANDDDQVDIADVVCVVNHVVDLPNVKFVEAAANVNDDDDVDLTDAVKIVDYIVGVIDVLAPAFQPVDLDQSALAPSLDMPLAESLAITKTAPAGLSDALYADDLTVMPGKDVLMPVSLKNAQTARGYSFDLVLPEGVTLAKTNGGEYICELSDRQTGYVVRVNYKENVRTYSLLVYTLSENVLTGNDGVVCTLKLQAATDAVLGQYAASIQNCKYSTVNSASVALPRMEIALSIGSTLKGDANGDGSVTITDAVAVVNYILGSPSANFNIMNANVNGDVDDDGNPNISITDAVGIVNIILNSSGSSSAPAMDELGDDEAVEPE